MELKQEVGLGHFEGRPWPGFHDHAALCLAAYGVLVAGSPFLVHRKAGLRGTPDPSRLPSPGEPRDRGWRFEPASTAGIRTAITTWLIRRLS